MLVVTGVGVDESAVPPVLTSYHFSVFPIAPVADSSVALEP